MRSRRLAGVVVGVLIGLVPLDGAGAATKPTTKTTKPPRGQDRRRPPASFSVDVARFESLDPLGTMRLLGAPPEGPREYRGTLELRKSPLGVGAVNEVPFENYLKGIAEMPSGWPAEALKAQAIAARTYALYVLENGLKGSAGDLAAQICATEGCQVYTGTAKEQAPKGEAWAAAVEATKGQVLLFGNKPIQAKYSSSNGGRTVTGGKPYLKAVDDPDDAKSPLHRWNLDLSFADLGRAAGAPGPVIGVTRAPDGNLVLTWGVPNADGSAVTGTTVVTPGDLRAKVNTAVPPIPPPPGRSRTVPSSIFTLTVAPGSIHLDGRGYGHGIGMSQWGAYGKAQKGMKAAAILAAYYGGIKPATLPAGRVPAELRVAVDPGRPELQVSSEKGFRVLDGGGTVVAALAAGTWKAVPTSKGLKLVPPAGQGGPPTLAVLGIDPPSPKIGEPATIRFKPSVPALVTVTIQPPGGVEADVISARPTVNEELTLTLPPARQSGPYLVWLKADAGTNRSASQPLMPQVSDPHSAPATKRAGRDEQEGKWTPPEEILALTAPAGRSPAPKISRSKSIASAAVTESAAARGSGKSGPDERWLTFVGLGSALALAFGWWATRGRPARAKRRSAGRRLRLVWLGHLRQKGGQGGGVGDRRRAGEVLADVGGGRSVDEAPVGQEG